MRGFAIMTAALMLALSISSVGKNYLKAKQIEVDAFVQIEQTKLNHEMQEFGATNCHGFKGFETNSSTGRINCYN